MIETITCNGLTMGTIDSGYILGDLNGFDNPQLRLNIKENGNRHGAKFGSAFYGPRTMTIEGEIWGSSPSDYESKRRDLEKAFTILNGLQSVKFETRGGLKVKADCILNTPINIPYNKGKVTRGPFRIELVAPYPFFLSEATMVNTIYVFAGGGAEIPLEIPMDFVESASSSLNINNAGNVEAYPMIKIYGVIENPTIRNNTSGKQLSLTYDLDAETKNITIDTITETVARENGLNLFAYASGDFFTLKTGINNMVLSASTFGAGARADIIYNYHYLGL